jgi:hypothetical protein
MKTATERYPYEAKVIQPKKLVNSHLEGCLYVRVVGKCRFRSSHVLVLGPEGFGFPKPPCGALGYSCPEYLLERVGE